MEGACWQTGLINWADQLDGAQWLGLNFANEVKGLQLGVIKRVRPLVASLAITPTPVPSPTAWGRGARGEGGRPRKGGTLAHHRLGQLAVILTVLGAWEAITRGGLVDPQMLPPVRVVMARAWELLIGGRLLPDLWASVWRVLAGFGAAGLLAAPLGVALGLYPRLARLAGPLLSALRPLSPPAWIPLAILWFGIGDAPALFIIFVGTFFSLLVGVMGAARALDSELLNAARTLGASQGQVVRYVVLPSLGPALLTQARVGLGLAWMCVIAAEMVAVRRGLGFMMMEARNLFRTADVLAAMMVIAAVGVATDRGLGALEARLCQW